jgi:phage shock protein C
MRQAKLSYNYIAGIIQLIKELIFMEKKLYRSLKNRMLAGVCAGIADYFGLDPTVIRLAWVVFSCLAGSGVLAYIICAIVIPNAPAD